MPKPHALLVDDDEASLAALAELVEREGFGVSMAANVQQARGLAYRQLADLIVVDLVLPDGSGLDFAREMAASTPAALVLVTGHATVETAVEALRIGALDYLTKPVDVARLRSVLADVARSREIKDALDKLRGELRSEGRFGALVGASPAMQEVYDLIARVAPTDATVFVTGESGTGKELVARTLHELSRRRKGPFVPLNCSAVSPSLIESELFGHERGSFTGAERAHRGVFEQASGGTLLLDEVTEMPAELQAKLLRVLESSGFQRIGGEKPIKVDVRVVAASNRVPEKAVADGKLREDLLYRLRVFPIHLPPLRERGGDVQLLAEHFLSLLNREGGTRRRLASGALARLGEHAWPGNVRELRNAVQRAFILAEGDIGADLLLPAPAAAPAAPTPAGDLVRVEVGLPIEEAERRLILATLERYAGDKRRAAEVLGISLKTLYNRLHAYRAETASEPAGSSPALETDE